MTPRACAAFLCCALVAVPAQADDTSEALAHFQIGLDLLDRHAWDSALAEFLRSRSLHPTRSAVKNAAVCLRELGRFDEALDTYDELLARFSAELPPAEREAVTRDVAALEHRVGLLQIAVEPRDATVVIDGRVRDARHAIRLNAGQHVTRVYAEGYAPHEARVTVDPEAPRSLDVKLEPVARVGNVQVSEATGRVFEVVVDGNAVGTTPWRGTLAAGSHSFALRGEGEEGALAREIAVGAGDTNAVVLRAVPLRGELRVEPTPTDANVYLDGRYVAHGAWTSTVATGPHLVTLRAPWHDGMQIPVFVSSKKPQATRPALDRIRRVYVEAFGGAAPSADTRIRGIDGCDGGSCVGWLGGARLGYLVTPHVAVSMFFYGFDVSRQSSPTVVDAVVTGQGAVQSNDYLQQVVFTGLVYGLAAEYHLFDRTPLTFRLGTGVVFGNLTLHGGGTFGDIEDSRLDVKTGFVAPMISPEVRFGYRLTRAVTADIGVGAVFFVAPAVNPYPPRLDPFTTIPIPTVSQGLVCIVPVTFAVRVSF